MENLFGLKNPENLMLYNTMYFRKTAENPVDHLDIVYKDLSTNEVKVETIESPTMRIYTTKPEYRNYDYNKSSIPIEEVDAHDVNYRNMVFEIAKVLQDDKLKTYLKQCVDNKNYRSLRNAHKHRYVFASDYDIEDYVYIMWNLHYKNTLNKTPDALYLDIETDIYGIKGFPKKGNCPIDLVTIVDSVARVSHTFLLKTKDNPLIEPFLKDVKSFKKELHEAFDETYGELDYKIYPYDDELSMLRDMFVLINHLKRTFVFVWNMSFDIPFIIDRIRVLGGDPKEIICHPDFRTKEVYYVKDETHFDRANKGDCFRCSSYSKYMCQLNNYAAIRKGGHTIPSLRLNDIGKREVGDTKLDYGESGDLKGLSRRDFKKYVMYNIKDVLLQLGIDERTKDSQFIYFASISTATRYEKIFRQTVFLRNVAYLEYDKQGLVICNNKNVDYDVPPGWKPLDEEEEEKADGALVSDPLNNDHHGITIYGMRSKFIFDNVIDMDFGAMYPNIIITFNIADVSMIGKLIIGETASDYYSKDNIEDLEGYDAGKDFMENYLTNNIPMMGSKWFNLPTVDELSKMIV